MQMIDNRGLAMSDIHQNLTLAYSLATWPPISWRYFEMHFSWTETYKFRIDFTEVCSLVSN